MPNDKKSLKYFMREPETEIVTAPGPETFKDEEGRVIQFQMVIVGNSVDKAYIIHLG